MMPTALLLLLAALLTGCATASKMTLPLARAEAAQPQPSVAVPATVTLINTELGFVVMDYGDQPRPPRGTVVELYRAQQPVAKVRLTEPARGRFVTADIIEGEPRVGDQAR